MKWGIVNAVVFARKIIEITNDYERFYERDIIRRLFFVKEAAKNQGGNNY